MSDEQSRRTYAKGDWVAINFSCHESRVAGMVGRVVRDEAANGMVSLEVKFRVYLSADDLRLLEDR